jgi:TolB-like protein/DNA-binding winged helix-turn-helix (wHTH) protein/Flp pilus assembly protein TadD
MDPAESVIYEFGPFRLDMADRTLFKDGEILPLPPKALDTLAVLVKNQGKVVEKSVLMEAVWPDTFVEENNLSQNISSLRKALGDPDYIQTVARRGFRFVGGARQFVTPPSAPGEASSAAVRKPRRWKLWLALAAVLVAGALVARPYLLRRTLPTPGKIMLAVLPFLNLSNDPSRDYLADGMTEEIITQLGSLDPLHLGVIARTSAMQYKNTRENTAQIARELGVNYLLEGSIRRSGERLRVTAQLIQARDQTHIWAGNFDRDVTDILQLESEVARAIAAKTQLTLSEQVEARLTGTRRVNIEAHEAYLQGLQAWNLRTRKGSELAIGDFKQTIAFDANYAFGHAGLARVYSLAPVFDVLKPAESMPKARDEAIRAIALDDSLADAHTTLAFVKAHYEYDWENAEREFRRAIELNPSDAYAHFFYSNSYLSPMGRHDQAIAEMKKAIELDPLSLPIGSFAGRTYFWAHRYNEALAQFQKAAEMDPNFAINHERLSHLYACIEKFEDAIDEETKARVLAGEDSKAAVRKGDELRQALAARGPRGYWEKLLELSKDEKNPPEAYVSDYGIAILYARLGEKENALAFLEKAYTKRELAMTEIGMEPAFDLLRSHPRFADLVRQIGLPRQVRDKLVEQDGILRGNRQSAQNCALNNRVWGRLASVGNLRAVRWRRSSPPSIPR